MDFKNFQQILYMEKQEILKAFKQAEVDWCKPIKYKGLCSYFVLHQNIRLYLLYDFLIPLWLKYSTEKDSLYHFKNNEQRLDAIRKVIKDLENQQT